MGLEQQISSLVQASENLTGAVNNKIGEIDKEVEQAKKEFKQFQSIADNRYLNVVSATTSGHKLQNVNFGDWEYHTSDISPTRGCNALILAKKINFSVDPAVRGDMTALGTINALRIHKSKFLTIRRFTLKYCESYTTREIQIVADELNAASGWEIREILLPTLDPITPFYVLSTKLSLDSTPNRIAFEGYLTFDGVWGYSIANPNNNQYEYSGRAILLSDCGYVLPTKGV
ncbi:hypothetical protein PDY_13620 [Photobacterium damselae subsp. damselae]|uniref:hypothetical protein n=1 Tax=Photobacterium damselae TaxID=38293 RepID=UPI0021FE85A6|nr:hypothetical protein [Photobacterium damselae]BDR34314.1 hypothetical protein PDY_13620 [Photobacterium damselae subsp. damselae]